MSAEHTETAPKRGRISRRTLLVGAVAVGGPWFFAVFGRYAVGAEFEKHVADVLGLRQDAADWLIDRARSRLDALDYDARAAAFLAATTFPGNALLSRARREDAIQPFLEHLIDIPVDNMVYLGMREPVASTACAGLIRAT
jgi:hypothetical protein